MRADWFGQEMAYTCAVRYGYYVIHNLAIVKPQSAIRTDPNCGTDEASRMWITCGRRWNTPRSTTSIAMTNRIKPPHKRSYDSISSDLLTLRGVVESGIRDGVDARNFAQVGNRRVCDGLLHW
jgi:hypothetical protein